MSFKAKVSIDSNGVKEERSVLFIQTLLLGRTKNNIDKGTTQSNIDGYIELLDSSNRIYGQTNEKYKENSRKSSAAYRKPITYSRASNFGSKNEMWFIGIIPWFDGLGRLRYLDLDSILQACIGIARFFCAHFLTGSAWRREIGGKGAKQPGV